MNETKMGLNNNLHLFNIENQCSIWFPPRTFQISEKNEYQNSVLVLWIVINIPLYSSISTIWTA